MKIINWLVYALAKTMLTVARILPLRPCLWLAGKAGRLAYRLASGRRRLMLHNLKMALSDEYSEEEREEIAKDSMESLFIAMAEVLFMDNIYAKWEKRFEFEGEEVLERLIGEGRGFFVFGGHWSAWTTMGSLVLRFPEIPDFNMIARPLRNPYMQELLEYIGRSFGGNVVNTRGTGKAIVDAAQRGELIGLYMDQESRRKKGVFVDFFGRPALTHVVPGYLAWKHDIPLVPYWISREGLGKYKVVIREPLQFELTDDHEENNRIVAQAITKEIEDAVRSRPGHWLWAHNRWRRRPDGTKEVIYEKKKSAWKERAKKSGSYLSSRQVEKSKKKESSDKK